ncbi:CpaD family pilus assembly protein [Novosphingobium aerophilum]|uniref:CpaD family pilus assembly protein n=1 Tax=Novosphingobium aerophilum TaxID=2839843 RepID=UPI003FD60EAB
MNPMSIQIARSGRLVAGSIALSLGLLVAGCGGMATNRSMNSVHQPVVEKVNYTLDLATNGNGAGDSGLAQGEQSRLAGWFDAMGLKYGDRVFIDDPSRNPAVRSAVEAVAGRYGLTLAEGTPVTEGYVTAGSARIVVARTRASVPGCPDWSAKSDFNPNNGLTSNYGCATNSNLAAMIANPEDLLHGAQTTGQTTVMSASKAIDAYRNAAPTGGATVKATSSKDN